MEEVMKWPRVRREASPKRASLAVGIGGCWDMGGEMERGGGKAGEHGSGL